MTFPFSSVSTITAFNSTLPDSSASISGVLILVDSSKSRDVHWFSTTLKATL